MAITNSLAIGDGKNSIGPITFKFVNGKTIASKKITSNKSNTPAQDKQRKGFMLINFLKRDVSDIILVGFCKSGSLTAANYFLTVNKPYSRYLREYGYKGSRETPILNLYTALEDPRFTNRKVYAAYGGKTLECKPAWDSNNLPVITIDNPYEFIPDDTITIAFALSYQANNIRYEKTRLFARTLTQEDIDQLPINTIFVANNQTIPGLNPLGNIHPNAIDIKVVATAILHTTNVAADTGNATSLFFNMPSLAINYKIDKQEFAKNGKNEMTISSNTPQDFPAALAQNAVGAVLWFPIIDLPAPQRYEVTSVVLDANNQPIGLLLADTMGQTLAADPYGEVTNHVALSLAGKTIAYIDNIRHPNILT